MNIASLIEFTILLGLFFFMDKMPHGCLLVSAYMLGVIGTSIYFVYYAG